MLYKYNGKIYIKPFSNKIVEVKVIKKNNEYNVEPTDKALELTKEIEGELVSISLEEAVKPKNSSKTTIINENLNGFDL